jgi:hypothetical protein
LKKILNWIAEHDEKLLFVLLYIGISLVLSITVSLFWLLFAVLLHLALEIIRQSRNKTGTQTILVGNQIRFCPGDLCPRASGYGFELEGGCFGK